MAGLSTQPSTGFNSSGSFNSPTAGSIFAPASLGLTPKAPYSGPALTVNTPTKTVAVPGISGATQTVPDPLFAAPATPTVPTVTHVTTPTATHTTISTPTDTSSLPNSPLESNVTTTSADGTTPMYDTVTGLLTAAGKAAGLPEVNATTEPTAGSIFQAPTYTGSAYDAAAASADANDYLPESNTDTNPDDIKASVLSQFQSEIDAANSVYNDKLTTQNGVNANRLGSNAAVQARRGLLGSTFGASDTDNINTENASDVQSINDQRSAAISSIVTGANAQAASELATKQASKDAGVDAHLNYLKNLQTEKGTNATTLAQAFVDQGIDPSTIPASQLASLAASYGVGVPDVTSAYAPLKKAADTKNASDAADLATKQATAAKDAASAASIAGEGDGNFTDDQQSYATNILAGNATLAQVPAADRGNVSQILAGAGTASYSPLASSRFANAATKIAANFIALPAYQLAANGAPYLQRISAAIDNPGSISDQDLLDSITKLNTAGGALSDAQTRTITDGQSVSDTVSKWINKLGSGGVLSDSQRTQIQQLATAEYANYKAAYEPVYQQVTSQFQAAGIPQAFWTIPDLDSLSTTGSGSTSTDTTNSSDSGSDFGWNG